MIADAQQTPSEQPPSGPSGSTGQPVAGGPAPSDSTQPCVDHPPQSTGGASTDSVTGLVTGHGLSPTDLFVRGGDEKWEIDAQDFVAQGGVLPTADDCTFAFDVREEGGKLILVGLHKPNLVCPTGPQGHAEIPADLVHPGQALPLPLILGWVRYAALNLHDYSFDKWGDVRHTYFADHPIQPTSAEVAGPGDGVTEGWVIETYAYNHGHDQYVKITWRVQFDGDYLEWAAAQVLPLPDSAPR